MPEYEVTLAQNLRSYRRKVIEAPDDKMAIEQAKTIDWLDDKGVYFEPSEGPADVEDAVLMIDALGEGGESDRTVADEIPIDGQAPYGAKARAFVEALAELDLCGTGALQDARRLAAIVREARLLCGVDDAYDEPELQDFLVIKGGKGA